VRGIVPSGRRKRLPSRRTQPLETLGVIVIVILVLAFTIVRYWHNIAWRAR